MFGNDQIETLAERVLRREAEQSGRSAVPANDNTQAACIDDRVSDLIDNPFSQLGPVFHGHAFRIRNHLSRCPADLAYERAYVPFLSEVRELLLTDPASWAAVKSVNRCRVSIA